MVMLENQELGNTTVPNIKSRDDLFCMLSSLRLHYVSFIPYDLETVVVINWMFLAMTDFGTPPNLSGKHAFQLFKEFQRTTKNITNCLKGRVT